MWRTSTAFLFITASSFSIYQIANAQEIELPGIVVTASPLESQLDETFVPLSIITENEIDRIPARSIGDVYYEVSSLVDNLLSKGV